MPAPHLVFLAEEPSMEAFLNAWLPRYLSETVTYQVITFQGKRDLLDKLEGRLRGYVQWMPADWRILVIVDRDDDSCIALKSMVDSICQRVGLPIRTVGAEPWNAVSCIAIEELEAWYFGDWSAVIAAYPRINRNAHKAALYRDPDAIAGGTWEAFERLMHQAGYFRGGLEKVRAAREIGALIQAERSTSGSFLHLARVLKEACA